MQSTWGRFEGVAHFILNCRVSHFALIELGISAFGSVLAFIVSVVITAGLEKTCKAFTELDSDLKDYP